MEDKRFKNLLPPLTLLKPEELKDLLIKLEEFEFIPTKNKAAKMLVAKLLSKIYKKGGVILVDSSGQKYICGTPDKNNPTTIKLMKKI